MKDPGQRTCRHVKFTVVLKRYTDIIILAWLEAFVQPAHDMATSYLFWMVVEFIHD